jgi:hypothetical protein
LRSLLGVGQQQPPDVLAGVAGHVDELDLRDTRSLRRLHGRDQPGVGGLLARLDALVVRGSGPKFRHDLILAHGPMVAHMCVANSMIPP